MTSTRKVQFNQAGILFWCFTLFSLFGYGFETLVRLVRYGHIEGTQGLIALPFSQIYGFGAVLLLIFYPLIKDWTNRTVFVFCSILGGVYEYLASWLQEAFFHTTSWDYSEMSTSIGGRTNLLYALVWGLLSLWAIRYLFPPLIHWLNQPRTWVWLGFTWILFMVILVDAVLSSLACIRYVERSVHEPCHTQLECFIDQTFPDDVIQHTYPYLHIHSK